jgi:amino acid adenylation domain-containing protein
VPEVRPDKGTTLMKMNGSHRGTQQECTIIQVLEDQWERTPDATAVTFGDRSLTYRQLADCIRWQADGLRDGGVAPGMIVAIYMERSLEMLIVLISIMKLGAAYLPLDSKSPVARIRSILADAKPSYIVSDRCATIASLGSDCSVLEATVFECKPNARVKCHQPLVTPSDLAYVIYTSGSTGKPKGVEIEHRAVANMLMSLSRILGLSRVDTFLAITTIAFDISVLELLMPLAVGGHVVISDADSTMPEEISRTLNKYDVTVMQATPTTWSMLVDAGWLGKQNLKILCGGEALSGPLSRQLLLRSSSLWNLYGPTETTVWSTIYPVTTDQGQIPIGRPIDNTAVYILDDNRTPVATGVVGNIYISGLGVARGYLNAPDLTAAAFVRDPFAEGYGSRMYHTGDLGRFRSDGNVEWVGRADSQVKIRGYRIEPAEIESALLRHELVKRAVVIPERTADGEEHLVAYFVAASRNVTAKELVKHLRSILPAYMMPSRFRAVDVLPVTLNFKLDRSRLESETCRGDGM